jgi:hypothetical protein
MTLRRRASSSAGRLPSRSKRRRTWPGPANLEEFRDVYSDCLGDRVKERQTWARSLTTFEARERSDTHPGIMREPFLRELGRPAEVPQVLGNTPEYVLVAHGASRRLPAILFQAA